MKHLETTPVSKVHGANMAPIWGRQDPGGPHVGPMDLAIWDMVMKTKPSPGTRTPSQYEVSFPRTGIPMLK